MFDLLHTVDFNYTNTIASVNLCVSDYIELCVSLCSKFCLQSGRPLL